MTAYLEVWRPQGMRLIVLDTFESPRVAVGRATSNDVVLSDKKVSRLQALFEPVAGTWCVCDLSSRNGTFVNGAQARGQRPLRAGDEIRIGETRFVDRTDDGSDVAGVTEAPNDHRT